MIRFSKTYPSFLTVKEGSTSLTKPLFPQEREDVTALRCSEPLRYKVGGPSKVYAIFCGMGPPGEESLQFIIFNYKFIAFWVGLPFLFLIAVSLCTGRRSNEDNIIYSTFDRITSGEVPIRVMAEIL